MSAPVPGPEDRPAGDSADGDAPAPRPHGPGNEADPAARRPGRGLGPAAGVALGVGAVAAGLTAAGVRGQPVAASALLFLLVGPGAALGWALPGQALRLRLLVALLGGLVADTLIAQTMLSLRWWSPRGGALAALLLTAVLCACRTLTTRHASGEREGRRAPGPADPAAGTAATD